MSLKLMYVAGDPKVVDIAQRAGVDRIWIDMEVDGKEERQHNMDTLKSHYTVEDVKRVRPLVNQSELLVRINPWGEKAKKETELSIKYGADIIMLPMWKNIQEVQAFVDAVGGRAKTMLLLETKEADQCLDDVLMIDGIDEIHIGINDLHLSYGKHFLFEMLSDGTVDRICKKIKSKGIPYGFGGITRVGTGMLPAEKVIFEHYRIGSSLAILSRSFCIPEKYTDYDLLEQEFFENLNKIRKTEELAKGATPEEFEKNRIDVVDCVKKIVEMKRQ